MEICGRCSHAGFGKVLPQRNPTRKYKDWLSFIPRPHLSSSWLPTKNPSAGKKLPRHLYHFHPVYPFWLHCSAHPLTQATNSTSSDLDNGSIPLTSMHSNIHTFAVNPFVPIILNNKHYSLIYLGTGPTSNMSDYSVNASAESPAGSWPALPPSYYSPHTMENIFTTNANINASTLHNIATSQVQTIKNHKEIYHFATIRFEDRIKRLKAKIQDYAETYKTAPDRYMYNTNYPDLRIPLREGIYTEAYWVTLAHNRYIQAYSQEQGPLDTPYSLPIYAHPVYLADPTEPIPTWFHQLLTGTPAVYANFAKAAH